MEFINFRGFLLLFFSFALSAGACAMPQVQSDFYRGLNHQDNSGKVKLFEKALKSPNVHIRQAAAQELSMIMSRGTELSTRTNRLVRQEISGLWAAAFDAVDGTPVPSSRHRRPAASPVTVNKEKAISFLLTTEQNTDVFAQARLYVMLECVNRGVFFSDSELAAIEGHFSILGLRYGEAVGFFRVLQEEGSWPAKIPEIFYEYPNLINDLGRAFQYTSSARAEGLELFRKWQAALAEDKDAPAVKINDMRYRLVFYAARIARQMGQRTQGLSLFEQALTLAPDGEQLDACVWYILDATITNIPGFIDRLRLYVPNWYNGNGFNDVLERFLHLLVSNRRWEEVIQFFNIIKDSNAAAAKAGCAWVIARTIEEGYLSSAQMRLVQSAAQGQDAFSYFMRFAYDSSWLVSVPSLYYRLLSAASLGLPFLEFTEESGASENGGASSAVQFLLGFFSHGAGNYALPYIRSMERELSPDELRAVAQGLEEFGDCAASTRLISLFINRADYKKNRRDLELFYPRPFREQMEKYAQAAPMQPALFYGLVRTESAFRSAVVSHAGAIGLSQLMPATAREMIALLKRNGGHDYGEPDLTDPDVNLHIGSFHFNYLMERLDGDTMLSLLSYNSGMSRVRRWWNANSLPADLFLETVPILETRDYGKRVIATAAIYEMLYYKTVVSVINNLP